MLLEEYCPTHRISWQEVLPDGQLRKKNNYRLHDWYHMFHTDISNLFNDRLTKAIFSI